eukprot:TRINITY_DN80298_c0_g1_i1.p1 TRINITY_DN80298_c0_g1~~TRINITY_DN80298_c0_g1_i1.p1  ORF type:complete len:733 (-),score=69.58 TRINITY_DN80298_c0_g1_i1:243-2441(-)
MSLSKDVEVCFWELARTDEYRELVLNAANAYHRALRCTSPDAGHVCMGAPGLGVRCESLRFCSTRVMDRPSIAGMLGVFPHKSGFSVYHHGMDNYDGFVYILCVVLVFAFGVVGLIWLAWLCQGSMAYLQRIEVRRLPQATRDSVLSGLRRARQLLFQDALHDLPLDLRMRGHQLLEEYRLERFRQAAWWVFFMVPLMVAWIGWEKRVSLGALGLTSCPNYLMFNDRFNIEMVACFMPSAHWQSELVANSLGTLMLLLCCIVATLRPDKICGKMISATHVVIYIGLVIHVLETVDWEASQSVQGKVLVFVRAAAAVIDGSLTNAMVLNASATVSHILVIGFVDAPSDLFLRESALCSMLVCLATVGLQRTRSDLLRQFLLMDQTLEESSSVKGVLDLMCDAVCELRDDRLSAPCPKLAALTMRDAADDLLGRALLDMVCQDDRERLSFALSDKATRCSMLHVRLLDGLGDPLPVHVFLSRQGGPDAASQHIIGIREDAEPGMLPVASAANEATPPIGPKAPFCLSSDSGESEGVASSRRSRQTVTSLDRVPEGGSVTSAPAVGSYVLVDLPKAWPELPLVWIKPEKWEIAKTSRCFFNIVRRSSMHTPLLEWMQDARMRKTWLDFAMAVHKQPHDAAGSTMQVKLKPPALGDITMTCSFTFLFVEETDTEDTFMAFLVTYIRLKKKTKQKTTSQISRKQNNRAGSRTGSQSEDDGCACSTLSKTVDKRLLEL